MLRFFLKKRILKKQRKKLIYFYIIFRTAAHQSILLKQEIYTAIVSPTLPKRQQHFNFFDLKKNKAIHFSTGFYLKLMGRSAKFFKRHPKNVLGLVLQLKKDYPLFLRYIYLYYLKNFNYRQFKFFKKLKDILNPEIYYLIHKQSFLPKFLRKHRIKKRVFKSLAKQ